VTGHGPDFDELVGDVSPAERARLERAHELLVQAGPPPELSPRLVAPPDEPRAAVVPFPRRYQAAALGAAAALAVALFGAGYAIGRGTAAEEAYTVPMTGAGGASAKIVVFARDAAGNWPMELSARGLPPLAGNQRYELWLTKAGDLVEPCGTFVVSGAETEVALNAPYRLRDFDGWVVVVHGSTTPVLRTATL
jgi:hypothetical protein